MPCSPRVSWPPSAPGSPPCAPEWPPPPSPWPAPAPWPRQSHRVRRGARRRHRGGSARLRLGGGRLGRALRPPPAAVTAGLVFTTGAALDARSDAGRVMPAARAEMAFAAWTRRQPAASLSARLIAVAASLAGLVRAGRPPWRAHVALLDVLHGARRGGGLRHRVHHGRLRAHSLGSPLRVVPAVLAQVPHAHAERVETRGGARAFRHHPRFERGAPSAPPSTSSGTVSSDVAAPWRARRRRQGRHDRGTRRPHRGVAVHAGAARITSVQLVYDLYRSRSETSRRVESVIFRSVLSSAVWPERPAASPARHCHARAGHDGVGLVRGLRGSRGAARAERPAALDERSAAARARATRARSPASVSSAVPSPPPRRDCAALFARGAEGNVAPPRSSSRRWRAWATAGAGARSARSAASFDEACREFTRVPGAESQGAKPEKLLRRVALNGYAADELLETSETSGATGDMHLLAAQLMGVEPGAVGAVRTDPRHGGGHVARGPELRITAAARHRQGRGEFPAARPGRRAFSRERRRGLARRARHVVAVALLCAPVAAVCSARTCSPRRRATARSS